MYVILVGCDVCLAVVPPVEDTFSNSQRGLTQLPQGWQRIAFSALAGPRDGHGGQSIDVCPNCLAGMSFRDVMLAAIDALGRHRPGWYQDALAQGGYTAYEVSTRLLVPDTAEVAP